MNHTTTTLLFLIHASAGAAFVALAWTTARDPGGAFALAILVLGALLVWFVSFVSIFIVNRHALSEVRVVPLLVAFAGFVGVYCSAALGDFAWLGFGLVGIELVALRNAFQDL